MGNDSFYRKRIHDAFRQLFSDFYIDVSYGLSPKRRKPPFLIIHVADSEYDRETGTYVFTVEITGVVKKSDESHVELNEIFQSVDDIMWEHKNLLGSVSSVSFTGSDYDEIPAMASSSVQRVDTYAARVYS